MTGNAGVNGGHDAVPLVTHLMEVGVTHAAEKNFDLHVALRRIASRNCGGGRRRCRAGSRVSFRFVHSLTLLLVSLCLDDVWCCSFENGAYRSRIAIAAEPEQRSRRAGGRRSRVIALPSTPPRTALSC